MIFYFSVNHSKSMVEEIISLSPVLFRSKMYFGKSVLVVLLLTRHQACARQGKGLLHQKNVTDCQSTLFAINIE